MIGFSAWQGEGNFQEEVCFRFKSFRFRTVAAWMTIKEGGRIFPVQDSRDLPHKNFIYYKMVIAPCPEDDSQIREVKYSLNHLEKTNSRLAAEFQTVIKRAA